MIPAIWTFSTVTIKFWSPFRSISPSAAICWPPSSEARSRPRTSMTPSAAVTRAGWSRLHVVSSSVNRPRSRSTVGGLVSASRRAKNSKSRRSSTRTEPSMAISPPSSDTVAFPSCTRTCGVESTENEPLAPPERASSPSESAAARSHRRSRRPSTPVAVYSPTVSWRASMDPVTSMGERGAAWTASANVPLSSPSAPSLYDARGARLSIVPLRRKSEAASGSKSATVPPPSSVARSESSRSVSSRSTPPASANSAWSVSMATGPVTDEPPVSEPVSESVSGSVPRTSTSNAVVSRSG